MCRWFLLENIYTNPLALHFFSRHIYTVLEAIYICMLVERQKKSLFQARNHLPLYSYLGVEYNSPPQRCSTYLLLLSIVRMHIYTSLEAVESSLIIERSVRLSWQSYKYLLTYLNLQIVQSNTPTKTTKPSPIPFCDSYTYIQNSESGIKAQCLGEIEIFFYTNRLSSAYIFGPESYMKHSSH